MSSAAATQRSIPEPTKRQLRQEAAFGCCACGYPFVEYHHIIPFAQCHRHRSADMVVLCPNHHHQVDKQAVDEATVRGWKGSPLNRVRGLAQGALWVKDRHIAVDVATNTFFGLGFCFVVDGQPLLRLGRSGEGRLLVSLSLYSEADQLLLAVEENDWVTGSPLPWDLEFSENLIVIREHQRKVRLTIDARVSPIRLTGNLWRKGQEFSFTGASLEVNGVVTHVTIAHLALVGLMLSADTNASRFSFEPHPRLGQGAFVSWPEPKERLARAAAAYQDLVRRAKIGRNEPCLCGGPRKWKDCCGNSDA
jgi:hypothetical protein